MCCVFDTHILNGRFPGDKDGQFTCISNDGASVVDYMIASSELFDHIINFKVLDRGESDHFPITCQMKMDYTDDKNIVSNNRGKLSNFRKYK